MMSDPLPAERPSSTEAITVRAAWVPGWYNLDQSIRVGQSDRWWFYGARPAWTEVTAPGVAGGADLIFYNTTLHPGEAVRRLGRIVSIEHPELGPVESIATDRFGEYVFELQSGRTLTVEAEEGPGYCYDESVEVEGWAVLVTITEVREGD